MQYRPNLTAARSEAQHLTRSAVPSHSDERTHSVEELWPRDAAGHCPHCGRRSELLRCTKCGHVHGRCCGISCCNGCGGSSMHGF